MMEPIFETYRSLASLLDYPTNDTASQISLVAGILSREYPEIVSEYTPFAEGYRVLGSWEREEYFVRTFEVESLVSMDLGYLLFGEEYKRGAFLAMMQEEQQKAGNPLGHELADHLPNVLRLLPLMSDHDMAQELCCSLIIPAIGEIMKKMEGSNNLFLSLFRTLHGMMMKDFGELPYDRFIPAGDAAGCAPEGYGCGFDFLDEIGKTKKELV